MRNQRLKDSMMTRYEKGVIDMARNAALSLSQSYAPDIAGLMSTDSLEAAEKGIRQLNTLSEKCWLLSSIALYSLIYNKELYKQSGAGWYEYLQESQKRLGIGYKDVYEQITSANFFIRHHKKLTERKWDPAGSKMKLVYAPLALDLTGDLDAVIDHICKDSFREFRDWYQSFRELKDVTPASDGGREVQSGAVGSFFLGGKEAVKVSDEIDGADRERLCEGISLMVEAMAQGKAFRVTMD